MPNDIMTPYVYSFPFLPSPESKSQDSWLERKQDPESIFLLSLPHFCPLHLNRRPISPGTTDEEKRRNWGKETWRNLCLAEVVWKSIWQAENQGCWSPKVIHHFTLFPRLNTQLLRAFSDWGPYCSSRHRLQSAGSQGGRHGEAGLVGNPSPPKLNKLTHLKAHLGDCLVL